MNENILIIRNLLGNDLNQTILFNNMQNVIICSKESGNYRKNTAAASVKQKAITP